MKKVLWMACLAAVAMALSMSGASAGDETADATADKDAMIPTTRTIPAARRNSALPSARSGGLALT